MKTFMLLMVGTMSLSVFADELLYKFECPNQGYSGEVYQDRMTLRKFYYNSNQHELVAYYEPKDEENDFKLTYNKYGHELVMTHIGGEMSEVGYARYRDQITLNLITNDIVDNDSWMLVPIPFWKTIKETEIDGKACRVLVNKLRKKSEVPFTIDWKKSERQF